MTATHPELEALDQARSSLARLTAVVPGLVAATCAAYFGCVPEDLVSPRGDRTSVYGRKVNKARSCAVSLLHCGAGWSQARAADAFSMRRQAATKAVQRVEVWREEDQSLDHWLSMVEEIMGGGDAQVD